MTFYSLPVVLLILLTWACLALLQTSGLTKLLGKRALMARNCVLLLASYGFLCMADWRFCALLALVTLIGYFAALGAAGPKRKLCVALAVAALLLVLGVFKYLGFFAESVSRLLGIRAPAVALLLPLGVSFYTFSAIGYVVDVSRGKLAPDRDLAELALYLAFFPKLISGPIARARDFLPQLREARGVSLHNLSQGMQIFLFGLFKKLVLADRLGVFVADVFAAPAAFSSATVALAVLSYSLQICLDFSGYSDMAIGLSKTMGFDLCRNFNLPYLSQNLTEFWKRWHISLSSWLQEYVYIPLGGNRKGRARTYLNLALTMVIGGLWHGANWTFVVWGALHGLGLIAHKAYVALRNSRVPAGQPRAAGRAASILATFAYVSLCWVFFRAESVGAAFALIGRMFAFADGVRQPYVWTFVALLIVGAASWCAARRSQRCPRLDPKTGRTTLNGYYPLLSLRKFWPLVAFLTLAGLTLMLAYTGGSPFLYGKF